MKRTEAREYDGANAWFKNRFGVEDSEPVIVTGKVIKPQDETANIAMAQSANTFEFSRGKEINVSDIKRGAIDMNA